MELRLPSLARLGLLSSATGWVAACYGALYVFAAGDFGVTGSLWVWGWPFAAFLLAATLAHVALAGGFENIGLPSPFSFVRVTNRVLHTSVVDRETPDGDLATALSWLPWAPVAHTVWCVSLSALVVAAMVALEWSVAGSARNVGPILMGGTIATLMYGGTTFTLCEILISSPCQRLRLAAVARGLDPYRGPTVDTWTRVVLLASRAVLALVVALKVAATPERPHSWLAQAALVVLSAGICGALAWLQALGIRNAAADLGLAATRLARNETGGLIIGSIDADIVGMARAFNAAAGEIVRARQLSAARYAALFEGAGDAILLIDAATGRIREANRRAQELLDRGSHTLQTVRFDSLFADDALAGEALTARRWQTGARVLRADGSECPVDVALSTVSVGENAVLQAVLHDVSQRERNERDLRQALKRLEELYRLAVTLGGTVEQVAVHVATTLAELLDVPLVAVERLDGDELVMLAMYDHGTLTHGSRIPLAGTPCECVREEKQACVFTDAADRFPLDPMLVDRGIATYTGLPIVGRSGEVVGIVCVLDTHVRTIREWDTRLLSTFAHRLARGFDEEESAREREAFVRQLSAQNTELRAAQERLTEADRLKSEFMGMVSHELRTPLNIFIGYTELLLESAGAPETLTPAEQRDVLERMLDAGRILSNLVEDTLSVLRIEAGGVPVHLEPVSLAALFAELRAAHRFLQTPSRVEERWQLKDGLAPVVSDRLKLRQILTNLVGNARKFTESGTIVIEARVAAPGWVAISVTDTGPGIAPEDLPHIFDLYRQVANGGSHEGCGIGLYIVRRYCELLEGRVEVTSELGRGTCFTVLLPYVAPPQPRDASCPDEATARSG